MICNRKVHHCASEERLEKLIIERLESGANKEVIDKRIWDLFGEQWCIMFTDLSGFSRRAQEFGIIHFLQTIYESNRLLVPVIDKHDGILLKTEGDSFFVIFRNVAKGLSAAIDCQKLLMEYNKTKMDEEKVLLCVGLGFGKVLRVGDSDVFGIEVNAASRLGEDIAKAGEILVTESVKSNVESSFNVNFEILSGLPAEAPPSYRVIYF